MNQQIGGREMIIRKIPFLNDWTVIAMIIILFVIAGTISRTVHFAIGILFTGLAIYNLLQKDP